MKCIPMTLSGLLVDAAISSMLMLEVLLASMASGLQISSNSENVENFSSGISGMASTTRSLSPASPLSVHARTRESAAFASSSSILPLDTSLASDDSIEAMPWSTKRCSMSIMVTS
uniref:Uncharacterized protein n=1 Tax=uncultured marine group II/III euryarchaeote AD1000_39_H06 TaxID=1457765 RepID=A0A075FQ20_9EURY|nr:hypothetical protein [uncultured marine group II/III euryarchaeote AD1000_39_H06]